MSSIESELIAGASLASPQAGRRRFVRETSGAPLALPGAQHDLLLRWIRPNQARRKWATLLADAGSLHLETALQLADWLLRHGWSVQYEKRAGSRWNITWLEFPHLAALRELFQLPNPEQLNEDWSNASRHLFADTDIATAHADLAELPLARRLQRFSLLKSLARWCEENRQGTRRDFALLARGDSKGITTAEWSWLAVAVDLEKCGIFEHTPHLLVAGPIRLHTATGIIDLNASADWSPLTPETIATAQRCDGRPRVWRLIENLTSFERSARQRTPDMAVVWLPGFPPSWWQASMRHLLAAAPAPAEIACDPDPAGIAIALQAAKLWEAANLPWLPFAMRRDDLLAARQRKPLTEHDRQQLAQLLAGTLPPALHQIAVTLLELGEKAEQESYL
jgi:hypothetical protein